ncbi:uncharacterized oxidoreductase YajO [Arthrobacter sp. Hiyo6]|nr:uncharacterized oxidoreductase YajO [Arthrobacter sp. Hiyo6]
MTEYRRLGKSGLTVSVVGLGCNNLGRAGTATESQEGTDAVVHAALEAGVTLFDVADTYGREPGLSETMLGKALGTRRADAIVATKFGMDMRGANGNDFGARGSRRYIVQAAEASLRRLGTDWIDLYQFHTPDPLTPIDETLAALDELVTSGKVRYIGHSNRAGWQIAEAEFVARQRGGSRFISTQNHYNLLDRRAELEVTPAAEAYGWECCPISRWPTAPDRQVLQGHRPRDPGSATPAPTWCTTPTGISSAGSTHSPPNGTSAKSRWHSPGWRPSRPSAA